jgi:hypothetical protein
VHSLARELDVKTWRQLLPTISSMLDSARGVMIAMFFIIYVAIGILILNAMLMAVFERIREFGVLKALGVGPFDVLRLILVESAIQTAIAILVGVSLAVPGILYLSRTGIDLGKLGGVTIMGIAWDPVWRDPRAGPDRGGRGLLPGAQGRLDPPRRSHAPPLRGESRREGSRLGIDGMAQPLAPPPPHPAHSLVHRLRHHAGGALHGNR